MPKPFETLSLKALNALIAEAYLNISARRPTAIQIRRCEELLRAAVELSESMLRL